MVGAAAVALVLFAGCSHEDRSSGFHSSPPASVEKLRDGDTFIVTDLLGSVLDETTISGESKTQFATYPFGTTRYDTTRSTWKYASSPRDGAVGLDHMGARFYAPDLGVWTSPDPVAIANPTKLVTADFAAANPYAYANQTPLIAADHDGHFWHIVVGAFIGALVGGASEAVHQYLEHGKIEAPGRIGAAAAAGAVAGTITAINPGILAGGVANVAAGVTRRLIESHGASAGSLHDVMVDAATGVVAHVATVFKGGVGTGGNAGRTASAIERIQEAEPTAVRPTGLRFSQRTASANFSEEGRFSGKTIGGLSSELRGGIVSPKDVPVGYVRLGDGNLIVNTRSALSLTRAGIPQESWNLVDMTTSQAANIESRLGNNGLDVEGTDVLRITGLGSGASNLQ